MRPLVLLLAMIATLHAEPLQLTLRSRPKTGDGIQEKAAAWEPKQTAIIVCDMWDDHWCKSAARRVTELAALECGSSPCRFAPVREFKLAVEREQSGARTHRTPKRAAPATHSERLRNYLTRSSSGR